MHASSPAFLRGDPLGYVSQQLGEAPQYTWRGVTGEQDEACHQNAASVKVGDLQPVSNSSHTTLFFYRASQDLCCIGGCLHSLDTSIRNSLKAYAWLRLKTPQTPSRADLTGASNEAGI